MSFNIAYNFEAIDNFTRVSGKISASVSKLENKIGQLREKAKNAGKAIGDLGKKMMLRVTVPLVAVGVMALKSASNIEDMNISFESMLHSATKAKAMVKSLIEFTARTPFHLEDVQGAAQQLLAFGFSIDQVMEKIHQFADISAITHVPLQNLAEVFGMVHTQGKMTTREFITLSRMKIPVSKTLMAMAKAAGHANVDIKKLAASGAITEKVFNKMIKNLTTGTGVFAGAADKLAHSFSGLLSTLQDNLKFVLAPIGDMIIDSLQLKKNMQSLINVLGKLATKITAFGKAHKQLTKVIVLVGIFVAALAPILVTVGMIVATFLFLINPISLAITGIIALVSWLGIAFAINKKFRDSVIYLFESLKFTFKIIGFVVSQTFNRIAQLNKFVSNVLLATFKMIGHVLYTMWVEPLIKLIHLIKTISGLFSRHTKKVEFQKNFMLEQKKPFAREQTFTPLSLPQQRVKSDVNITLLDPGNFVQRMTGKTQGDGNLGFNLGANMLPSYI